MKNYETNIKKILDILLNTPRYLTLDYIAHNVGLSKRSVQNYLASIDEWIKQNGLLYTNVIRKQGQGVKISINAADRLKIEKLLYSKHFSVYSDDNKRRLDIINKLIILEEDITIKSLAEQFYVSRSNIISDLEWVKEWLASYKLELYKTQRKGIVIRGSEVSHRNAIAGYFDLYEPTESDEGIRKKHDRIQEKTLKSLIKVYTRDTIETTQKIIESAEKEFDFIMTEDYFTSLLTHIVISISRFMLGNTVSSEFIPPDDEEFPVYITETAEFIVKCLEAEFGIEVSDIEKTYICIHLVGFNALSAQQSANTEMPKEIKHLALELIKSIDSQLNTYFIRDKQLFFGLSLHLKSKIFRLKKEVYYKKTTSFELLDNNVDIYNAADKAGELYHKICGVEPDEEEIFNITCYFLLSLHRNMNKLKALLICNDGVTSRFELMNFIQKAFPLIEITDCCTIYQLEYQKISENNFIISTEAVDGLDRPVADLSAIDKANYTALIAEFIDRIEHSH